MTEHGPQEMMDREGRSGLNQEREAQNLNLLKRGLMCMYLRPRYVVRFSDRKLDVL